MTIDTARRIKIYKEALPGMKERIMAALLMLVIALSMAIMSTYAWMVVSRAPAVSGIATSMAANGSLEIALAKPDGSEPVEFDIDEAVPLGVDLQKSNVRWGNLINLSDPSYGIDHLALRPAQLNTAALSTNPLVGVSYGADGRIVQMDGNYAFAVYNGSEFRIANNQYGVRAIASYVATIADSTQQAKKRMEQAVTTAHTAVHDAYRDVPGKFAALGTMVSKYAQDKLDNATPGTNLAPYLGQTLDSFYAVETAMIKMKDAYVALANYQNYLHAQNAGLTYSPLTWADIERDKASYNVEATDGTSANGVISLVKLNEFITDLAKLQKDIGHLETYKEDYDTNRTPYYWNQNGSDPDNQKPEPKINEIIQDFIHYTSMTVDLDNNGVEKGVTSLSSGDASSLLSANGKDRKVYVYNGILKRFEQTAIDEAYRLNGNAACTIRVTYVLTITINGKAYTKADGPSYFSMEYEAKKGSSSLAANDAVAQDTYGMAVDFWIRTNAEQTYLTLEGAVARDEDGTVLRYDGVNRVWGSTGEAFLTTNSTTQGGGSAYIYYADTPEDMMRSLKLLEAMKVAFVDETGNLLASASMDTAEGNYHSLNGRITVPLVLDHDSRTTYEYTNDKNEVVTGRAIMSMNSDVARRITAIVYLDGTHLTNDMVLAAADIQGQLNLQFGSSENLSTAGDKTLMNAERIVTAVSTENSLNYETASTDADLTTRVNVTVDGTDPRIVTAFFVRAINATQGSRETEMTFTKLEDGKWSASYKFNAPGTYYLRHIRLDGVDYALEDPITVEVEGFVLEDVAWSESSSNVVLRTSENSHSIRVETKFATNNIAKMPKTVSARFVRQDGNILNVPLSYNSSLGKWIGTGTFMSSGIYELQYLVLDDRYKSIDEAMVKTIDLSLGLYTVIRDRSGGLTEEYEEGRTYDKEVGVRIYNNRGEELVELENMILYYSNGGSSTNTINTNITWNELENCYIGTLPITRPGRYLFASVRMDGNYLTRRTESPTYVVISPDPPVYNPASQCTYNGNDNIQFVPLTNDAVIDGIRIDHSSAATILATVYNDTAQEFFQISSLDGGLVYTGSEWSIKLPTYNIKDEAGEPTGELTQEGTWKVAMLSLYGCYDEDSNLRDESNPIIWMDPAFERLLNQMNDSAIRSDAEYDFSRLSTTVSCSIRVQMTSGTTALGSGTAEFMTRYPVSTIGMRVLLTDDAERIIPANKVDDVLLKVNYAPSATDGSYGYKVQSGAAKGYEIHLNTQEAETGYRTVSEVNTAADADWQYVGKYNVDSLTITIGGATRTYRAGNAGVPNLYTITTKGPDADNIALPDETVVQRYVTLGKTGGVVTSTFLQSEDLGITAKVALRTDDNSDTQYVVLENVAAQVILTYRDGKTAPNGGYSWSGTSQYETITLNMTNTSGTFQSPRTPLLAGTYSAKLKATIGSAELTKDLQDVVAFSKAPTLTVTDVTPGTNVSIKINPMGNAEAVYEAIDSSTIDVQNYFTPNSATVYMAVKKWAQTVEDQSVEMIQYEVPKVRFEFGGMTNFTKAELLIPNAASSSFNKPLSFTPSELQKETEIGGTTQEHQTASEEGLCGGSNEGVNYQLQYNAGVQVLRDVYVYDSANCQYTISLAEPVTVRQTLEAPPSIRYQTVTGYNEFDQQVTTDGGSFTVTLPTQAAFGTQTDETSESEAGAWNAPVDNGSQGLYCYVETNGNVKKNTVKNCNGSTTYYYFDFTYYQFEKMQVRRTQTSNTRFYNVVTGLTGWKIGDKTYAPGETITVDSAMIAVPIIGELEKTFLREQVVKQEQYGIKYVPKGTSTSTGHDQTHKTENNARKDYKLPDGYQWFDTQDPYKHDALFYDIQWEKAITIN